MYKVDGFLFEDEKTANLARKEEEGIRFIKERTALNNPEVVLKLYTKLIDEELFVTPVGTRFLTELQNILLTSTYIAKDEIPAIPVESNVREKKIMVSGENDTENYKKPFYVAVFFAIVFGLSVVGMFIVSAISGNNVTILNYREEIQNEYSIWEEELKTEEERLEKWETLLEERENQLRDKMNGGN